MKTVLITGASTGIGAACALHLDKQGWHVFAGVRKDTDGQRLKQEASERLMPVVMDVTQSDTIQQAARVIAEQTGESGLNGLVNNAGIAVAGPLEFVPISEIQRQLAINVTGQIAVTQAFLPLIRKAKGRVVNMGSVGGRSALPFVGAYNASKYALEGITDTLRVELRPWRIHVSIIEPGAITTPIWEKSSGESEATFENLPPEAQMLYGRVLKVLPKIFRAQNKNGIPAEKVAEAVHHALTAMLPKNRYVVGRDARMRLWLERLPDGWRDKLVAGFYPPYGE